MRLAADGEVDQGEKRWGREDGESRGWTALSKTELGKAGQGGEGQEEPQ